MTDQELIDLVDRTPPDELSAAQVAELRRRLPHSAELRQQLAGQLRFEQYMGDGLGGMRVSVDQILLRAGGPAMALRSSLRGWLGWGLGMILVAIAGSILVLPLVKKSDDDQSGTRVSGVQPRRSRLPGGTLARSATKPSQSPTAPATVLKPALEPWTRAEHAGIPDPAPEAELPTEAPWSVDLADTAPPLRLEEVCFEEFDGQRERPSPLDLARWWSVIEGEGQSFQSRPAAAPIVQGLLKLKAPWPADAVLRLALSDLRNFKLHVWNGQRGVTLQYYNQPRPT